MKPHLPLLLLSSLLAAFTASAVSTTYLAEGVEEADLAHSERFYDVGKGYYWLAAGRQPVAGLRELYAANGNSLSFLGDLRPRLAGTTVSTDTFKNLRSDSNTCGVQVPANMIQYWLSYYGPLYTGTDTLAYGLTYSRDNLEALGGTQSLDVGMLFYDTFEDQANNLSVVGKWYLCGTDALVVNDQVNEKQSLKPGASAGGWFADYFADSEAPITYLLFNDRMIYSNDRPTSIKSLTQELVKGFGFDTAADGTYGSARPGQLVYLSLMAEDTNYGHALTCYGFETDEDGMVTALKITNSDDMEFKLQTLYVKVDARGRMGLYTDAACSNLWIYSSNSWYISGLEYINTPEHMVDLYTLYTDKKTPLVWTGLGPVWSVNPELRTTDELPGATTGWDVRLEEHSFHSYYSDTRSVCFDDTAASCNVHLGTSVAPAEMHLNNAVKDYLFIGESGARLQPDYLIVGGTGSATFRNVLVSTHDLAWETYTLNLGQGGSLNSNRADVGLHGVLELSGGSATLLDGLTFGRNSFLRVSAPSTLTAPVTMLPGSEFACVLSAAQTEQALLSITGSLTLGNTVKLEVFGSGLTEGTAYRICTVTEGSIATGNIFTEHGPLSFSDNTLWLVYREVPAYTWNGGNCRWSASSFGGESRDTVHTDIEFNGGRGTITLVGKVSPHHLSLHGGTYIFDGAGASIDCEGEVTLDGNAALTLKVPLSAEGISLHDTATLTLYTENDSSLSFLSAAEHTHVNFQGSVTYTVEDIGVMAGDFSVGTGTTLEIHSAHDEYVEGSVQAAAESAAVQFVNASAARDITVYDEVGSLEHFLGTIRIGKAGDAHGTTLRLSHIPTSGQYDIAAGSTLHISIGGTVDRAMQGKGTVVLDGNSRFDIAVKDGRTSLSPTLALAVQGTAVVGTPTERLGTELARELNLSGDLSLYMKGGTTLHYDRVTLDGGSYTSYTAEDAGDVIQEIGSLHVGKRGGTLTRELEFGLSHYDDAGITRIGSLTGEGNLTFSGEHYIQMNSYFVSGVGADGFRGNLCVNDKARYIGAPYQLTVLQLGSGVYDGEVSLTHVYDDPHSRAALGISGNVTLRGLEAEAMGSNFLYSGALKTTKLNTTVLSPIDMIRTEAHTLTLDTARDFAFSGTVIGPLQLVKKGAGQQSFLGSMQAFSGSVAVEEGTLFFAGDTKVSSARVEEQARLQAAEGLTLLGGLEMNGGELIARSLTSPTASFRGHSVIQAESMTSTGAWTLHLSHDNLHAPLAELQELQAGGALTLGGLDISYNPSEIASSTYKLLTLSSEWSEQLSSAAIRRNGALLSIGAEGSSPLYLQSAENGTYDLMLAVTDGTAPLPRGEYAVLHWQPSSGVWSVGTGLADGVWESEQENTNFHAGDEVVFSSAATVTIDGRVAPSNIIVDHSEGTVCFEAAAAGGGIAGQCSLVKTGGGTLVINTADSYSGTTTINGGTLVLGQESALGTGIVSLTGGTLDMGSLKVSNSVTATGGTFCGAEYAGQLSIEGDVTLGSTLRAATLDLVSGTLHGDVNSGRIDVINAENGVLDGSLTLSGGSITFAGTPLVVTGTLTLDRNTRLGLTGYTTKGTYALVSADAVNGNVASLVYAHSVGRRGYEVSISGSNLVLTVTQLANNLTWRDAKGTWSAGTSIGGAAYTNGDTVNFLSAAAVTVSGQVEPGAIVVNSAANVSFVSDKKRVGSGIAGDCSVTKSGAGMLTMNAGNTYSGGTVLNAGTLKATAIDSFGTGAITVNGGTLDLGSKAVANDIVLSGTATLKGDAKYTGSVTVAGDATLSAKTSYKGMTTIGSGSTLTLAEKATMAGSIAVDGGGLKITAPKGMTLAKGATLTLDNGGSVNGLLTVGAGSTLVWADGSFAAAPVLKGGTLDLGAESSLTLTGSKAQVAFGDKRVELPGKGIVYTDETLTVNGGTVTLNAVSGYESRIDVAGGTLKLATGKVTTDNEIVVSGNAAVVNGKMHFGDITVNGTLAKGTNITIAAGKTAQLNGAGVMLGTIAGAGTVDVNASIDATAAKITAAHINLNNGTFTNTKGIKLSKGQTLNLGGASLDLGPKGALATAAGSTLVVSGPTSLTGSLTLGGGELVFAGGTLNVDGMLTLSKAMTVKGSGTITYDDLKPFKGDISVLFGGAEVVQEGNTLTITGEEAVGYRLAPAPLDMTPALPPAPVTNPVADAMAQADWGILDAERAFMGAVNSRHQHAALLDKGRGAAWVSAFGSSVRHGNKGVHHGSDGNLSGAAFGLEHAVSETGSIGLAVGRSKNRLAATGVTHLRQETAHVALYGQKQLAHGFTADAAAAYGDTETKLGSASWTQKSAALTARLTHAQQVPDATALAFRTFGGLAYEATDAGSIGSAHTGSVQNLRAELGAGITHTAGKAHLYAEAALTGDLLRHNPTADLDGFRTHGANPGRIGLRAAVGGLYEFTDTWSGTASYGIETESRSTSHTLNIGVSKQF